jgi:dimethylhistidine N-methyltransferase
MNEWNAGAGKHQGLAAPVTPAIDEEPNLAAFGFAQSVAHGMTLQPKRIASKWLYDAEGSRLFDDIVASPRYYLPRAEMEILRTRAPAIASAAGPDASLVELGSGSSTKVRILLDALIEPRCYVPIEISEEQLKGAAAAILRDYPLMAVSPLAADYTKDFELPASVQGGRVMAFFPGSTLCNLLPHNSVGFLRRMHAILGPDALFLAGVDLKKDEATMLAAYNDPEGAIWRFNLNVLDRMNRELGTGLDRSAFRHAATYNRAAGRIEAAIYPLADEEFTILGRPVALAAGEPIVLEYSHKYRVDEFQNLAREAGWTPVEAWTDSANLFSVHLLSNAG